MSYDEKRLQYLKEKFGIERLTFEGGPGTRIKGIAEAWKREEENQQKNSRRIDETYGAIDFAISVKF